MICCCTLPEEDPSLQVETSRLPKIKKQNWLVYYAGFAAGMESLEKVWNSRLGIPDLEKVWKLVKSFGKRRKVLEIFFFFQSSLDDQTAGSV